MIVITNGTEYIYLDEEHQIQKTTDISKAKTFTFKGYNKWKDELVPERLKCFFTTWAYEYRIGKDQDECESLLKRIYENAEVAGFMDYEEFKEYMLQFVK